MNLLERTIGVFNPGKALKMIEAREKLKMFTQNQKIMNKGYGEHGASSRKKSLRGWFAIIVKSLWHVLEIYIWGHLLQMEH